jgi:hypothetical protein
MPMFMKYDGFDQDAASDAPTFGWTYSNLRVGIDPAAATGEPLIHIESTAGDSNLETHNVELMVKILNTGSDTPEHVESGWLLG